MTWRDRLPCEHVFVDRDAFQRELDRCVSAALAVADRSPDVRDEEREMTRLVDLIRREPSHADQAEAALVALVPQLCETPPPAGLVELLSYCVHALGLPKVVNAAKEARDAVLAALETGPSLRPWEHARRCEVVMAAAEVDWDEQDMYESFSAPTAASVNFVLLYRGTREWRTTVGSAGELACGALPETAVSDDFDLAADEFARMLREHWGVDEPINWKQIRPDWWGADLVPGALAAAGEETP